MKIEKLVFGGQALARAGDKVVFVWGALPDEEVEARIDKKGKDYNQATAVKIIKPSSARIEPKEEHFLSCSPWQILEPKEENAWKQRIARETFEKIGGIKWDAFIDIAYDGRDFGYRNKMEYFLAPGAGGRVTLAFFRRGTNDHVPIDSCLLAKPEINETAKSVLNWINRNAISPEILKRLIIRADEEGRTIASLFLKEECAFTNFPLTGPVMVGFRVYMAGPVPADEEERVPLFRAGADHLSVLLKDVRIRYGPLSFFQVNIPVFKEALVDISGFLEPARSAVDYYSGVGAVSLPLFKRFTDCTLVDSSRGSIADAKENIKVNGIENCKTVLAPAERAVEHITSEGIMIFDPPRAGLHRDVINKVLDEKPIRIIYLSCNLSSQARDIKKLAPFYAIKFLKLYNFFPRTPHIEGLCVLDRI